MKKNLSHTLIINDVSNNVNFNKNLKSDIGYKELGWIKTSPIYLKYLCKNVFEMIRQFGPLTFFVTMIMC